LLEYLFEKVLYSEERKKINFFYAAKVKKGIDIEIRNVIA